ncbi:MAG: LTA synthase family protein [Eubacteriales bacterium]|nr:LTA synthase family protein [Eubacteriales bacterium]
MNIFKKKANINNDKNIDTNKDINRKKSKIVQIIQIPFIGYLLLACVLNFVLEMLSRHSFIKALRFVGHSPAVFAYNAFIIFVTLSLVLFAKRKVFATVFVCAAWIASAFANWIVLCFRTTPFSAIDILMLRNVMTMLDKYMTKWQMVLSVIGIILVIILLIYLYVRLPKTTHKRHPLRASAYVCMCGFLIVTLTKVAVETQTVSDNFGNLAYAYNDYGFAYCFSNSIIDVGISKPKDYSEERVKEIVEPLFYDKSEVIFDKKLIAEKKKAEKEKNADKAKEQKKKEKAYPNVIVIQLESVFDTKYMRDFYTSENPMPFLAQLKRKYSSGLFTVPAVGAGTANTEFEVQTGMSTQFFGAGEYPFKTVMKNTTCDSMAYDFKRYGYTTTGFHNNDATFYERYIDYSNLGFESFSGMEHMWGLHYTPRGWAKDDVLDDLIVDRIKQTKEKDYITTITVQCHGRYPKKHTNTLTNIDCYFAGQYADDKAKQAAWEYYVNMCKECDNTIRNLVRKLEELDEPTVLFMYGDHLPSLDLHEEDLNGISLYETEWVMWDNMGLRTEHKDIKSYQASTYIFNRLKMKGGLMQNFHNKYMHGENQKEYLDKLETLEYDTLYGNRYAYDQTNPFPQTDMTMGIRKIKVKEYKIMGERVWVYGKNFNEFSEVHIDGQAVDTIYASPEVLIIDVEDMKTGNLLSVVQVGDDHIVLSETDAISISTEDETTQSLVE